MEKLLKIQDVAEAFGVAKGTVNHWCQKREIPFIRLPKGIRFRADEIDAWLKRKKVKVQCGDGN